MEKETAQLIELKVVQHVRYGKRLYVYMEETNTIYCMNPLSDETWSCPVFLPKGNYHYKYFVANWKDKTPDSFPLSALSSVLNNSMMESSLSVRSLHSTLLSAYSGSVIPPPASPSDSLSSYSFSSSNQMIWESGGLRHLVVEDKEDKEDKEDRHHNDNKEENKEDQMDVWKSRKAIVVLGKRLLPEGKPTPTLITRIQKVVQVYRERFEKENQKEGEQQQQLNEEKPLIILSGGVVEKVKTNSAEAQVMRDLLLEESKKAGVSIESKQIILEPFSRNTIENFIHVKSIMIDLCLRDAVIITSYYHMKRSLTLAQLILNNEDKDLRCHFEGEEDHPDISQAEKANEEDKERSVMAYLKSWVNDYRSVIHNIW